MAMGPVDFPFAPLVTLNQTQSNNITTIFDCSRAVIGPWRTRYRHRKVNAKLTLKPRGGLGKIARLDST